MDSLYSKGFKTLSFELDDQKNGTARNILGVLEYHSNSSQICPKSNMFNSKVGLQLDRKFGI